MIPQRPLPVAARPPWTDGAPVAGVSGVVTLMLTVTIIAALYFGREIFVPLALAMLLSFALAPLVRRLRQLSLPRLPSVLAAVTFAFLLILTFGWIVSWQLSDLAGQLPRYQQNIEAKIEGFRESPPGGRLVERVSDMLRDIGRNIDGDNDAASSNAAPATPGAGAPATPSDAEAEHQVVTIEEPAMTPMQIVRTVVGPLIGPLATAGIVIVFVIFMLLKREDLRDRVIRLAGARDLPRTTEALDDAAQRVARYLLLQLVVNVTYGIPIGIGLWLIGVPNPVLWGMLAIVLRFVPYIGPIIAAIFPLALAIAVDPGWMTLLWTAALFIVIELISNNAVEPWLYGSGTGLSPIAIIAAAIFWTWLWGPVGLLLSTPLTVCVVVLGRHVPQLAFLDILFGDEPALSRDETLYQRLLGGDPDEATERAEEYLRKHSLLEYYDEVGIPALALAEEDRVRGALDEERIARVVESATLLIDNLAEYEEDGSSAADEEESESDADEAASEFPLTAEADRPLVVCAGSRGPLDELAATMLASLLERGGMETRVLAPTSLYSARLKDVDLGGVSAVVLSYMSADSFAHARFLVRRLRRRLPDARYIIGFWTLTPSDVSRRDPLTATGADQVATSLAEAIKQLYGEAPAAPAAAETERSSEPERSPDEAKRDPGSAPAREPSMA